MKKIYFKLADHGIIFEIHKTLEFFCNPLKDLTNGRIVKKVKDVDCILRLVPFDDTQMDPSSAQFTTWRDNGVSRGLYLVKKADLHINMKSEVETIILSLIDRISKTIFKSASDLNFHASSVERCGKGYMFLGKSGSGKTTICRLSGDSGIIHDEVTIARKKKNNYFLFSLRPSVKNPVLAQSRKLKSIFFIKKSRYNRLKRMSLKESLKEGLEHCRNFQVNHNSVSVYERLIDLFKNIPCYRLYFKKDPSFWKLIDGRDDGNKNGS